MRFALENSGLISKLIVVDISLKSSREVEQFAAAFSLARSDE
jgi:hypothetical protein